MKREHTLYRLLYVSDKSSDVPCDIEKITETSRAFNSQNNITGSLWFDGVHFLQLLEGSKDALNEVFQRILMSRYHENVDVICFQKTKGRIYGDWALSYFGSQSHNREVAEHFSGGADLCLRSLRSGTLIEMLSFLEQERQNQLDRCVG